MEKIIDGIKILEQTPIEEGNISMFWSLIIIGALIALLFLNPMCAEKIEINKRKRMIGKIGYILGLLVIISSLIPMTIMLKETGRYTYKCIILDDEISAKYISDNFNIVSVENDIWTIEDK